MNAVDRASALAKKNALVVCCTPDHVPYALATLLSCCQRNALEIADLHIIVFEATTDDECKIKDFVAAKSAPVRFHNVVLDQSANGLETNSLGVGTLLRLYLNRRISPDYDRVLYLDSDVLALGSVATMFEIDLEGKPLGAVEDLNSIVWSNGLRAGVEHFKSLGLKHSSRYFNAGVLLMDWRAVLKNERLQNCIETGLRLKADGIKTGFADQDLLNIEFENDWKPLGARFNMLNEYAALLRGPVVFRHFAGLFKPWAEMLQPCSLRYSRTYRSLLRGSTWQLPKRLKWKKDTEWCFREFLLNRLNFGMRRALRDQLPSD